MPSRTDRDHVVSFGPFRLITAQRLLLEGNKPIRLGSRALDILIALVERRGELLSKEELMAEVWPNTSVEEGNLKVHVASLRRVLGDGRGKNRYLVNIPGRGYRFVAPMVLADDVGRLASTMGCPHNLPIQLTRLIGRSDVVGNLVQRLPTQRLVTIVGTAGVGKTAVALDVAEELIQTYEHGVWLIDLARIADPRLVPTALASALGLEIRSEDPLPGLIVTLSDKQMLIVLDNCEHVVDAAAALAAGVLTRSRGVLILATSREPLRAEGERLLRLPALESPPPSAQLSAVEALRFPAVQLFAERAAATMNDFELNDEDAASAARICRELDGIPLAIEFAAARVDAFGVHGLAARLDDRLRLLTRGSRADLPRHQTIGTALDWSYQLLSQEEQTVFRRLAIFAGGFTLAAASVVAAGTDTCAWDIADTVANLVMKSLVTADMGDREIRFRLLETQRAYCLAKLTQSGEADALGRQHAAYYRELPEAAWSSPAKNDIVAAYAPEIDNIRAALTWAFAPGGDGSIAVALAAASAPIWLEMALLTECHGWMAKALDLLDAADRGTRREMVLQSSLGLSLMHTQGMSSRARAALMRACELAESLRDLNYQLQALAGLTLFCLRFGDFRGALVLARQSKAVAKRLANPAALSMADSILAAALFYLGRYAEASIRAKRAYRRITPGVLRADIARSGLDRSIWPRGVVVHALWLQGLLDQSAQSARNILADALAGGQPFSLCLALTWCGCMISLRLGDLETAERSIGWLKDHSEKHALSNYYACGLGFEGQLRAKQGDSAAGERLLRACLEGLRQAQFEILYAPFLSGLAEVLAVPGRFDDSVAAAGEALQRTERSDGFWWMPEALRIKGDVLVLSDRSHATAAEDLFRRSLDLAHRQKALSWELRAAMSLGRLQHSQGRSRDACDLLKPVYARFTEGFETADLRGASLLLDEWGKDAIQ